VCVCVCVCVCGCVCVGDWKKNKEKVTWGGITPTLNSSGLATLAVILCCCYGDIFPLLISLNFIHPLQMSWTGVGCRRDIPHRMVRCLLLPLLLLQSLPQSQSTLFKFSTFALHARFSLFSLLHFLIAREIFAAAIVKGWYFFLCWIFSVLVVFLLPMAARQPWPFPLCAGSALKTFFFNKKLPSPSTSTQTPTPTSTPTHTLPHLRVLKLMLIV